MKDLEIGRVAPPEELEQLMPLSQPPEAPATMTQATEQGAKDAAVYFAEVSQFAFQQRSSQPLELLVRDQCQNCADLISTAKQSASLNKKIFWQNPKVSANELKIYPYEDPAYFVQIELESELMVTIDAGTHEIQKLDTNGPEILYFGVVYHDGQWKPWYMNLHTEPEYD